MTIPTPHRLSPASHGLPPFEPHRWLDSFHRQTLFAALCRGERWRRRPPVERLVLPVDAQTRLAVRASWQPHERAPVCVLVHGLGGSAESPYMLATARKAWGAGFHVLRVNLRGAGEGLGLSSRPYHSGLVDDVAAVLEYPAVRAAGRCVLAGFSMGGNLVLRLAGLRGERFAERVAAVAAVSPSIDLSACADALDKDPAARWYRDSFVRGLMSLARTFAARGTGTREFAAMARPRTLRAFDDGWTAPVHGFRDAADYYASASALPTLGALAVPALVIQSADDRLVPASPLVGVRLPPGSPVLRVITPRGGHCGWVAEQPAEFDGRTDADRLWAENRVVQFLASAAGLDERDA